MFGSSGLATMFGSSGSQFFIPTTGIQLGPKKFDKSRLIITFLTNLGVTDKLCSFRLVLEGKIGQEVPNPSRLEFLEKFLANNFTLSDAEDNHSESFNRECITDLSLLKTLLVILQKSLVLSFWGDFTLLFH